MASNTSTTPTKTGKGRSGTGISGNPHAMQDWDEARNADAGINPNTVSGETVVHFHCGRCNHDYERKCKDARNASAEKPNCIFCAKSSVALCGGAGIPPGETGHCGPCYMRTYAGVAATGTHVNWTWSANNEMQPHEVIAGGSTKCLFDCNKCGHEFQSTAVKITAKVSVENEACPFCFVRAACSNEECLTCEFARAKNNDRVDPETVKKNRSNGVNACKACKELLPLSAFEKRRNGSMRNTCMVCRNRENKRRDEHHNKVAVESTGKALTRECKWCQAVKSTGEFHSPGSHECAMCYNHRRSAQFQAMVDSGEGEKIGGKDHLGPKPESCRDCGLEFTEETSGQFFYRGDRKKFAKQCNSCHNKSGHIVNPDTRMVTIRRSAEERDLLFLERDAKAMKEKLTLPCAYCAISPTDAAGLDRVDNSEGYTDANTVPCCTMCNMMKGAMHVDAFRQKIDQIANWAVESKKLASMKHGAPFQAEIDESNRLHNRRMREIKQGSVRRTVPFRAEDEPAMRAKLGQPCSYCGDLPLETGGGLDRVDNNLGYTDANTVACCGTCNGMKRTYTKDEFYGKVARISSKSNNKRSHQEMADEDGGDDGTSHRDVVTHAIPKRNRVTDVTVDASTKLEPATRKLHVVFFNTETNAVAFVATSQKEAGDILGMQPDTVSRRLSQGKRTSVWLAPYWGCYRSTAASTMMLVDNDERARFIAALSARPGGLPTRIVKSYRVIGLGDVKPMECKELKTVCETLCFDKSTLLELLRQAAPDAEGMKCVGPLNNCWWVEETTRRENIIG